MWKGIELGRLLQGSGKGKEASVAGKELGEGKRSEVRLWRFGEQIIKDLKGQNKVELYSKCDGQLLVGFLGGVSLDLLCFQIFLALCGK